MHTALSLIKYDKKFQVAMEYVFGSVLICKNLTMAKQLAFHKRILRKCVTLEGDVVDPAGVFEGGAMPKERPMLQNLEETVQHEQQLRQIQLELDEMEDEIGRMGQARDRWVTARDQLEVKRHQLGTMQKMLQQTSHYRLQEEIQELRQKIGEFFGGRARASAGW